LWQTSEEKDVVILELQQAAATAHVALKSEKKQVEDDDICVVPSIFPLPERI
jgi:hypothetical protein